MRDYMAERQNIANPLLPNQKYPNRPNASPFAKLGKFTPKRKRNVTTIPKKAKRNSTPSKCATFTNLPRAAEDSVQTQQMGATFTVTKPVRAAPTNPATIPAVPNPPTPLSSQKRSTYCATCTTLDRQCLTFFPPQLFLHPTLIGQTHQKKIVEMVQDKKRRNKEKRNRENDQKELEHKSEKIKEEKYYLPSPQYTPYSLSSFDDDTLAPTLPNTLVPAPKKKSDEGQEKEEDTKDIETE